MVKSKFLTDDLSLESMVTCLFDGKSKGAFALECEDITDDACLSDEEIDVLEDDEADSDYLGNESVSHLADANAMALSLRAAESFLWKKAMESEDLTPEGTTTDTTVEKLAGDNVELVEDENLSEEDGTKPDSVWKKFWNWIKTIFEKIRIGVITFFKKVQIWLAGDMKRYTKWYEEYAPKHRSAIVGDSKTTLKIRPINIKFTKYEELLQNSKKEALGIIDSIANSLKGGFLGLGSKTVDVEKLKIDKEIVKKVSANNLRSTLYGTQRIREISAKDFFDMYSFENIKNADSIKTFLKDSQLIINHASIGIKAAVKASTITEKAAMVTMKEYASSLQSDLNIISVGLIWAVSAQIQLLNIALRYGNKIIKTSKVGFIGKIAGEAAKHAAR